MSKQYRNPALTVDALVLRKRGSLIETLVIRRSKTTKAFPNKIAICGGFVDYGEDPRDAVLRELKEETGLVGKNPQLVCVAGNPARDPRGHTVSICYHVELESDDADPVGMDDASEAFFTDFRGILNSKEELAFDHSEIFHKFHDYLLEKGILEKSLL